MPGAIKMLVGVVVNAIVRVSHVMFTSKVFVIPVTPVKFSSLIVNVTE